eukprot:scaffold7423_cov118-Isochrysis_galbana.AAC.2
MRQRRNRTAGAWAAVAAVAVAAAALAGGPGVARRSHPGVHSAASCTTVERHPPAPACWPPPADPQEENAHRFDASMARRASSAALGVSAGDPPDRQPPHLDEMLRRRLAQGPPPGTWVRLLAHQPHRRYRVRNPERRLLAGYRPPSPCARLQAHGRWEMRSEPLAAAMHSD